jgi:ParB-like chromosome segregation protein Spo0J
MTDLATHEPEFLTQPVRAVHPAALAFPEMSAAALHELAEDIRQNGQAYPSMRTAEGLVLDGRNRDKACQIAGVEPWYAVYAGGDPVGFIISSNLKRRQLNESQRALIATRLATLARGQHQAAGKDAEQSGPSEVQMRKFADLDPAMTQAAAAAALNISKRSVQFARVVLDHGDPELIKAVEQGLLPVSTAARRVKPPKPRPAPAPTRTKSTIDIRSIRSAFRRVEKSAASGNANKLRKCLGELQRAVDEALNDRDSTSPS